MHRITPTKQSIFPDLPEPSATVAQGYEVLKVRFKDGESATGTRIGKSDDPLVLREAAGNEMRYPQEGIATLARPSRPIRPTAGNRQEPAIL